MQSRPRSPEEQARAFETQRKVTMVLEWIEQNAALRQQAGAFGRMQVEIIWERGKAKRVKFIDEVVVEDMTDKERELVLRASSGDDADGRKSAA